MTARERRLVTALVEANPMHPVAVQQAQAALRPLLAKRRNGPSKSLPERSQKQRREEKRAAHREETAEIRGEVELRSGADCEYVDLNGDRCRWPGTDLDHWLGGSGRRRQAQSAANTWLLCSLHHGQRTRNEPDVERWNRAFARHCARYLYPFTPHRVHDTRKPL